MEQVFGISTSLTNEIYQSVFLKQKSFPHEMMFGPNY
jgi:hypothetical protein